jgi:hypothetical protein
MRLAPEEKGRFVELAASHGLSESTLALMAIRAVLAPDGAAALNIPTALPREPATDRITIRLRPGDGAALVARAAQRGVKASTYLAALVRAHLGASPILTADELHTVKLSVEHGYAIWKIPNPAVQSYQIPYWHRPSGFRVHVISPYHDDVDHQFRSSRGVNHFEGSVIGYANNVDASRTPPLVVGSGRTPGYFKNLDHRREISRFCQLGIS